MDTNVPVLLKLHINMITRYNIIVTRFPVPGQKKDRSVY